MQDRATICNDADGKKILKTGSVFITIAVDVILISYSFPLSVTITMTKIIEVVRNK